VIVVPCPCGQMYRAEKEHVGGHLKCGSCGRLLTIVEPPPPPLPPAASGVETIRTNIPQRWSGFILARVISIAALLWAFADHEYAYYQVLRFLVCATAAYGIYVASVRNKAGWNWLLVCVAATFNPIWPIHLDKGMWLLIDLCAAAILAVSIPGLRESPIA